MTRSAARTGGTVGPGPKDEGGNVWPTVVGRVGMNEVARFMVC